MRFSCLSWICHRMWVTNRRISLLFLEYFLKKRRRPVSNDFTVHTRRSNVYTCTCCFRCFRVTLLDVEAFHTSNLTVRCIDMWCGNLRVRTQEGQAMGWWQERLGTMVSLKAWTTWLSSFSKWHYLCAKVTVVTS